MRSFKSFLREDTDVFNNVGWDRSNTYAFLDKMEEANYGKWWSLRNENTIDILGTFTITNEMLQEKGLEGILPIPNLRYAEKVELECTHLKTFLNFPKIVGKIGSDFENVFDVSDETNPQLTSLEHCPEKIIGDAYLTRLVGVSFSRCDQHLKEIHGRLTLGRHYTGPILSILRIKELKDFDFTNSGWDDPKKQINKIMERHLHGDKDIIECKEELMSSGFKEYAKL